MKYCEKCGYSLSDGQNTCPSCGFSALQKYEPKADVDYSLKMRWYKCFTNVILFLMALLNLYNGFAFMRVSFGGHIEESFIDPFMQIIMEFLEYFFEEPFFIFLTFVYGLFCMGIAVLLIFARQLFVKKSAKSIKTLMKIYIIGLISRLAYFTLIIFIGICQSISEDEGASNIPLALIIALSVIIVAAIVWNKPLFSEKKSALKFYIKIICMGAFSTIELLMAIGIQSLVFVLIFGSVFLQGIIIELNYVYFSKRKDLFKK